MKPDYNYSYSAEKACDNLHDRYEDVRTTTCTTCNGEGKEYYSDCCGAQIINETCTDCKKPCNEDSETCGTCKGEGEVSE